jgi:divalent metal cation (Fe/Co/Zn/Cd) transporter
VAVPSNTGLVALAVVAGLLTGSVAIVTEALHSSIELLASQIACFSGRRAGAPADAGHRYGHDTGAEPARLRTG